MGWNIVFSYRLRFDPGAGTGDVLISHIDEDGNVATETLTSLSADVFAAVATILTSDKDHKIVFNGRVLDAGPEKP